jgi:hypothetical protein
MANNSKYHLNGPQLSGHNAKVGMLVAWLIDQASPVLAAFWERQASNVGT